MVSWIHTSDTLIYFILHTCFRYLPVNISINELGAPVYLQSTSKNNLNEKKRTEVFNTPKFNEKRRNMKCLKRKL